MTFVDECDEYLSERTGRYEYRAVRYLAAGFAMQEDRGLENSDTLYDIGAGWTELDFCLRTDFNWRRYIPIDGGIDGTDLEIWIPPRKVEWAVGLEILEHLDDPGGLVELLKECTTKGIVVSVPNPRTVDVLGIDRTHVTVVTPDMLISWGFRIEERMFYGGKFSNGQPDSLFGVWLA